MLIEASSRSGNGVLYGVLIAMALVSLTVFLRIIAWDGVSQGRNEAARERLMSDDAEFMKMARRLEEIYTQNPWKNMIEMKHAHEAWKRIGEHVTSSELRNFRALLMKNKRIKKHSLLVLNKTTLLVGVLNESDNCMHELRRMIKEYHDNEAMFKATECYLTFLKRQKGILDEEISIFQAQGQDAVQETQPDLVHLQKIKNSSEANVSELLRRKNYNIQLEETLIRRLLEVQEGIHRSTARADCCECGQRQNEVP
jgi:tetrahydromethanopterin S-methyltransferase subunit G